MPPITTHNIVDEHNDPVMNAFKRCQLFNNHYDRVKVRFVYCSPPHVFTEKRVTYTYARIFLPITEHSALGVLPKIPFKLTQ